MKTTSFLAVALVALGMSAQASPTPVNDATTSGSATIERVDPGCYYNCRKQGHVDCDWLCNVPSPDIPMAAAPAKPALAKRDYQCYIGCTSGCYGDNKCMDRCARQCVGSGRPPRKQ